MTQTVMPHFKVARRKLVLPRLRPKIVEPRLRALLTSLNITTLSHEWEEDHKTRFVSHLSLAKNRVDASVIRAMSKWPTVTQIIEFSTMMMSAVCVFLVLMGGLLKIPAIFPAYRISFIDQIARHTVGLGLIGLAASICIILYAIRLNRFVVLDWVPSEVDPQTAHDIPDHIRNKMIAIRDAARAANLHGIAFEVERPSLAKLPDPIAFVTFVPNGSKKLAKKRKFAERYTLGYWD